MSTSFENSLLTIVNKLTAMSHIAEQPLDYVTELKKLRGNRIHFKDEAKTNQLLNEIVRGGKNRLQIVSDFDRTITKSHEDGKKYLSSFALFSQCPSIPQEYIEIEKRMRDYYFPIELDPNVSLYEKRKAMEEWWQKSEEAVKGLRVAPIEIIQITEEKGPSIRDGTKDFFHKLKSVDIPLLVFSAGLGDAVVAILNHANVMLSNVKVISNFLKYDENGRILGFQATTPIHLLNKNEFALNETSYFELVRSRDNVILLGDALGDANMTDGIGKSNAIVKISFLSDHVEKNLPSYLEVFDIVLEDDQTMDIPRTILKHVLNA